MSGQMAAIDLSDPKSFEDLMLRVRSGDEHAASELVQWFEPLVRRELRIKMTDRRMAQLFDSVDVCQSIWSSFFVRVAAGQYDLDTPQQLAKLLSAMAKNKLASQARWHHAGKRDVDRMEHNPPELASVPDVHENPSVRLSAKELFAKIQESLSEEERRMSELRSDGLTWDAVAKTLGGTAQARRMQMDRAAERVIGLLGLDEQYAAVNAHADR
jgi:DNA-directed RNA polymerase specialized sigma24 family protein